MKNNKVIFFTARKNLFSTFGGDTTQMLKTKAALENKYGLNINIYTDEKDVLNDNESDIVHIFGAYPTDNINFFEQCKQKKKKIVLSTIFWEVSNSNYIHILAKLKIYPDSKDYLKYKSLINKLVSDYIIHLIPSKRNKLAYNQGSKEYKKLKCNYFLNADILLPNSEEEFESVCSFMEQDPDELRSKTFIVPNAVDIELSEKTDEKLPEILNSVRNFVIEAARICPDKNQLNVVKALYDNPEIPVIFAGKSQDAAYFNTLKKVAGKRGNVYFINNVPHSDIYAFYKKAMVHVLPSYRESPGLASLESLLCGCQIVVSSNEFCPIKYYEFDKYGFICNPYDISSIRESIFSAIKAPKNIHLPDEYKHKFSYENVAEITYQAYCSL